MQFAMKYYPYCLACCEKYACDVRLKFQNALKVMKIHRMWGIDNRLIVSSTKNHEFAENI